MKLSIPQITTTRPQEATRCNTSPRSASFSGIQETLLQPARSRRGSMQVPSLPVARRRSSVCGSLTHPLGILKRDLSDPNLEQRENQLTLSSRRGSIVPRARSGSVFAKGLGLPAIALFKGRRRSRILNAREIKIFRVSRGIKTIIFAGVYLASFCSEFCCDLEILMFRMRN